MGTVFFFFFVSMVSLEGKNWGLFGTAVCKIQASKRYIELLLFSGKKAASLKTKVWLSL